MFIGGLNWETTDGRSLIINSLLCVDKSEGLKAYMGQFGEIDSATIMRDPSGRSRGFAFLTYSNVSSVNKVMEQVHHLDGKQVSLLCQHMCIVVNHSSLRLTPSEQSLELNMKRRPKYLLVV
jgi:RNA recognition motif-containing protein